jgi:hypothetical protein
MRAFRLGVAQLDRTCLLDQRLLSRCPSVAAIVVECQSWQAGIALVALCKPAEVRPGRREPTISAPYVELGLVLRVVAISRSVALSSSVLQCGSGSSPDRAEGRPTIQAPARPRLAIVVNVAAMCESSALPPRNVVLEISLVQPIWPEEVLV